MSLNKESALYQRDEKGELLPIEVEVEIDETKSEQLEYKGEKICIIPMTRGEIRRLFATILSKKDGEDSDDDGNIILKYCVKPKFTEKEIALLKPTISKIIANTIYRESGIRPTNAGKVADMKRKEDEFGKN